MVSSNLFLSVTGMVNKKEYMSECLAIIDNKLARSESKFPPLKLYCVYLEGYNYVVLLTRSSMVLLLQ